MHRWLRWAVAGLAILVLGSWILVTVARVDDSYGTTGPWTALSQSAATGALYPPLFDGDHFGGTRYMPLQFSLYAAASKVTGEYFVSAKIVVALIGAGLLAVVYATLRLLGARALVAVGVVGAALATGPVLLATTAVGGDSLALLLQLAAVAAVVRSANHRWTALAGGLCALALLSKLSAIWAVVALTVWLAARRRAGLPVFLAAYATTSAAGFLSVALATDGQAFDNLPLLSTTGWPSVHDLVVETPRRFVTLMLEHAGGVWLLLPLCVVALLVAGGHRKLTVHQLSALTAALVTAAILTDEGAHWNHLADVTVLVAIVAGALDAKLSPAQTTSPLFHSVLLTALALGMATGYLIHIGPHLGGSLSGLAFGVADERFPRTPLAAQVGRDEAILSEDASIHVSRGQRPVVLDAFMLLRLLRDHPDWERTLVRRIDAREFDKVVLQRRLAPTGRWYTRVHFGTSVAQAIDRNYRLDAQVHGYSIYVPRVERRDSGLAPAATTREPARGRLSGTLRERGA